MNNIYETQLHEKDKINKCKKYFENKKHFSFTEKENKVKDMVYNFTTNTCNDKVTTLHVAHIFSVYVKDKYVFSNERKNNPITYRINNAGFLERLGKYKQITNTIYNDNILSFSKVITFIEVSIRNYIQDNKDIINEKNNKEKDEYCIILQHLNFAKRLLKIIKCIRLKVKNKKSIVSYASSSIYML